MPDWQDTLYEPASLSGVLPENDSYFQYMVILTRNDPDTSPTFYDLTLSWNPVSVSDHSGSLVPLLLSCLFLPHHLLHLL